MCACHYSSCQEVALKHAIDDDVPGALAVMLLMVSFTMAKGQAHVMENLTSATWGPPPMSPPGPDCGMTESHAGGPLYRPLFRPITNSSSLAPDR